MSLPFKCVCIFDGDRPNDIPNNLWIKKGVTYTVVEVSKMRMQGGILGFKLAEINLDSCFPYQYFSSTRFGIPMEDQVIVENYLEKLVKENKEELIEI